MKTTLRPMTCIPVVTLLLFNPTQAHESPSYYWCGRIGYAYMPDVHWKDPYSEGEVSFNGGPGLSLALGMSPGFIPLRIELEWLYQANGISDLSSNQPVIAPVDWASVSLSALMINGYIDIRNESSITPYLMGGFGYGHYSIELEEDNAGSTTVSAYQAGLGFEYDTGTVVWDKYRVVLDLGYRFTLSSNPEIDEALGGVYETEYTAHALMLGVNFRRLIKQPHE